MGFLIMGVIGYIVKLSTFVFLLRGCAEVLMCCVYSSHPREQHLGRRRIGG